MAQGRRRHATERAETKLRNEWRESYRIFKTQKTHNGHKPVAGLGYLGGTQMKRSKITKHHKQTYAAGGGATDIYFF